MVFGAIAGIAGAAAKAAPAIAKGIGTATEIAGGVKGLVDTFGGGGGKAGGAEGAEEGKAAKGGEAKEQKEDAAIERLLARVDQAQGPQDLKKIVDAVKQQMKDPDDLKKLGQKIAKKLGGKEGPDGSVKLELTPQTQQLLEMLGVKPDRVEQAGQGGAPPGGDAPAGGAQAPAGGAKPAAPQKAA